MLVKCEKDWSSYQLSPFVLSGLLFGNLFSSTFNNISIIQCLSEKHQNDKLYYKVVSTTPHDQWELNLQFNDVWHVNPIAIQLSNVLGASTPLINL